MRGSLPVVDFHKPITGRKKFYISVLKIAERELTNLPAVVKMERFLRWAYDDFIFLPGAVLLAGCYLTNRRVGALLKNSRSRHRQKALASVRNAVWDLQVIQQWCNLNSKQDADNRFWLLCSCDRALKKIARVIHSGDDDNVRKLRLEFFEEHWGHEDGAYLTDLVGRLMSDRDNPARRANSKPPEGYLDGLVADLETNLLNWTISDNRQLSAAPSDSS